VSPLFKDIGPRDLRPDPVSIRVTLVYLQGNGVHHALPISEQADPRNLFAKEFIEATGGDNYRVDHSGEARALVDSGGSDARQEQGGEETQSAFGAEPSEYLHRSNLPGSTNAYSTGMGL
jgi:hypothetical protein